MANEGDLAAKAEEHYLEVALRNAKAQRVKVVGRGVCLNCSEPLEDPEGKYCDADCRDDHAKRLNFRGF